MNNHNPNRLVGRRIRDVLGEPRIDARFRPPPPAAPRRRTFFAFYLVGAALELCSIAALAAGASLLVSVPLALAGGAVVLLGVRSERDTAREIF
jgi:Flp pilus assembly protein TadB